jgi:Holliday junction resolvasome RuvABC endonuclease subunit
VLVLGVDPGPTECGWALVQCKAQGRHVVVAAGNVPSEGAGKALPLDDVSLVCIECPTDVHPRGTKRMVYARTREVLRTTNVARDIELALHTVVQVVRLNCQEARRALCGNGHATDKDVSYWLSLKCEMPKRSNSHERDAIVVALAGWGKWTAEQIETQRAGAQAVLVAVASVPSVVRPHVIAGNVDTQKHEA